MPRIALKIEYAGERLCGSQSQAGVATVQSELEAALSMYLRQPIKTIFSGRTDSGVHAAGQVVHFDCAEEDVDLWRLCWGLNGILKADISVVVAQVVPDTFNARRTAVSRTYVYRILNRSQRSALLAETHYFISTPLDTDKMGKAAQLLLGKHDFQAFKSSNSDSSTTVCSINRAELLNLGEGRLEFWISADHFVYNMVRIIVGTLIDIGLNKRNLDDLAEALNSGKRDLAGPTAPSWGLSLDSIKYPAEYRLFEEEAERKTRIRQ